MLPAVGDGRCEGGPISSRRDTIRRHNRVSARLAQQAPAQDGRQLSLCWGDALSSCLTPGSSKSNGSGPLLPP
jgi:hypothetical protein